MCLPSLRYFQVIGKGRRGSNHTLHLWSTCRSSARGTCKACRICSGQQICQTVTSCILVYNPGISGMAHVIQTTSQMSNTNHCHGNSIPGNKRVLYRNTCFHKKCAHMYSPAQRARGVLRSPVIGLTVFLVRARGVALGGPQTKSTARAARLQPGSRPADSPRAVLLLCAPSGGASDEGTWDSVPPAHHMGWLPLQNG